MLAMAIDASLKVNHGFCSCDSFLKLRDSNNLTLPDSIEKELATKTLQRNSRYARAIEQIGFGLQNLAALNSSFVGDDDIFVEFSCAQPPNIALSDYVRRLTYALDKWGGEDTYGVRALIMSLVYIERIYSLYPSARLSGKTVHKVLLLSMLTATKISEDKRISHRFWAEVGGIELKELNSLEWEFCKLLCFDFHIPRSEFRSSNLEELALELMNESKQLHKVTRL